MDEKNTESREREWRKLLEECENRPEGMRLDDWCRSAGVSKTNYYYWRRKICGRKSQNKAQKEPEIVKVPYDMLEERPKE